MSENPCELSHTQNVVDRFEAGNKVAASKISDGSTDENAEILARKPVELLD